MPKITITSAPAAVPPPTETTIEIPLTPESTSSSAPFHADELHIGGAASSSEPYLDIAGFRIRGLDINSIERGELIARIPLNPGTYMVPGDKALAKLEVGPNCSATICVNIGRDDDGVAALTNISAQFAPVLKIQNPSEAFEDHSSTIFGRLVTWIRDAVATLEISGLDVDADGAVHLQGDISKGILGQDDLASVEGPDKFPKLNMSLAALISPPPKARDLPAPAAASSSSAKPAPSFPELFEHVKDLMGRGSFELLIDTDPTSVEIDLDNVHVDTAEGPIKVHVKGKTGLTRTGSLELIIDPEDRSEIQLPMGKVQIPEVQARVSKLVAGTPNTVLQAQTRADFQGISGCLKGEENTQVPFQLQTGEGVYNSMDAHTFVGIDPQGNVTVKPESAVKTSVGICLAQDAPLSFGTVALQLQEGLARTWLEANISGDTKGIDITAGRAHVRVSGTQLKGDLQGFKTQANGHVELNVGAHQLRSVGGKLSAVGTADYRLQPPPDLVVRHPEMANLTESKTFELKQNKLCLSGEKEDMVEQMLAPVIRLRGDESRLVDPSGPAAGPIGSQKLQRRITELTGAELREDNRVTLLVDGITSFPKRMEMINNARHSLCLQTMIFKPDETGTQTAQALVEAAQRGVDVRVIVDSLGNIDSLEGLINGNPIYKMLQDGGVKLHLYNDAAEAGLKTILEVLRDNPGIAEIKNMADLTDPTKAMGLLRVLSQMAQAETSTLKAEARAKLEKGLGQLLSQASPLSNESFKKELAQMSAHGVLDLNELIDAFGKVVNLNYRWHMKYLIADGHQVVLGGMNMADEYLLGGTGRKCSNLGQEREAWRDTDVLVEGPGALDTLKTFAQNWKIVSGKDLAVPASTDDLKIDHSKGGGTAVQMVAHRPRLDEDGDHNTENVLTELVKATQEGETCWIGNAYFCPTGGLQGLEKALMDAANRGVDVRILTNSSDTTDGKMINMAATFNYRRLLQAGVHIFERAGTRTMHQKVAYVGGFGGAVSVVGSHNLDNRSESINAESVGVIHGRPFGDQIKAMLEQDMAEGVAKEVHFEDISHLPISQELQNFGAALASELY